MLDKLEGLYFMPGGKLKKVAIIYFILGCVASLILGILVFDDWHNMWVYSVLIWVFGPLCSYISSLFVYGFGAIIDLCQSMYTSTNRKLDDIKTEVKNLSTNKEA